MANPLDDKTFNNSGSGYHVPVLLTEAIEGMNIHPSGTYVDCTFGGGGHSRVILEKLDQNGRLFVFDQDADARSNMPDDPRMTFVPHNFRHLQRMLRLHKVQQVNAVLADLGVSSHQFDDPVRGFSTRFDSALDMRMDTRQELTAYKVIATYPEEKLHKIFERYGEVTNSKTLAKTIVEVRNTTSLKTIANFKSALHTIVKGNPNKYFAQVFQALRIEVNDELGALKELLQQLPSLLIVGGRAVIITFHSLEDRLVKNFFRQGIFEEPETVNPFMNEVNKSLMKPVNKKPIVATPAELKGNPRARSAKMRIAEKI